MSARLIACTAVVALLIGGVAGWFLHARAAAGHPRMEAADLVRAAVMAEQATAYQGRQRVEVPRLSGEGVHTLEADVDAAPGGRMRITYRSAPLAGVTIWDNGDTAFRYNPQQDAVTVASNRATSEDIAQQGEQLLANYDATLVGADRRADRPVWVVDLKPHRQPAPWRRLWIDQRRWLILASAEFGETGRRLHAREFLSIRFIPSAQDRSDLFEPPPARIRVAAAVVGDTSSRFTVEQLRELLDFDVRQPSYLPEGYRFEGGYVHPCGGALLRQGARLEFSDGFRRVTLIECPAEELVVDTSALTPLAVGSVYRGVVDGLAVTATGELPRDQLRRLVESLPAGS